MLALASWYLLLPYDGTGPNLGGWTVQTTFASRADCEKAAKQMRLEAYQFSGVDVIPESAQSRLQIWRRENATCIASEEKAAPADERSHHGK